MELALLLVDLRLRLALRVIDEVSDLVLAPRLRLPSPALSAGVAHLRPHLLLSILSLLLIHLHLVAVPVSPRPLRQEVKVILVRPVRQVADVLVIAVVPYHIRRDATARSDNIGDTNPSSISVKQAISCNVGLVAVPADLVDALVLPHEVVDVAFGVREVHLVHAESLVAVEEELPRESRAEEDLALSEEVLHV